jgi:hypothetical protein
MKIQIIAESESKDDGFTGKTSMEREDIEDINGLLWLFSEFCQAAGFTYVKAVAVEKDDGEMIWSDF